MDKKVFDYKERWKISEDPKGVEKSSEFQDLGTLRVDPERYVSKDFMKSEWENIWTKTWLMACSSSDIKNVGDYFNFNIGKESIIVIRGNDSQIRAFYNVCAHRGSRVCLEDEGSKNLLVCPYHAWSYNLDGSIRSARLMNNDFNPKDWKLHSCNVNIFEFLCSIVL